MLEVGFGTGLNFLMTAQRAGHCDAGLDYVALERDVLPADTLAALNHGAKLGAEALQEQLVAWRRTLPEPVPPGTFRLDLDGHVALTLLVGDATEAALPGRFDAVYLDAFSPDSNPELWTAASLRRPYDALRPGGRLGTYSAKGSVRRALAEAGFCVEKRPGPPGKREVVVASRLRRRRR